MKHNANEEDIGYMNLYGVIIPITTIFNNNKVNTMT